MADADSAADVRSNPEVIADAIEQPVDEGRLQLHGCDAAGGGAARHRVARERDLQAETVVAPETRRRAEAVRRPEQSSEAHDMTDRRRALLSDDDAFAGSARRLRGLNGSLRRSRH